MKLEEFINKINKRVTRDCRLPVNIPEDTIISFIDEVAEVFYTNHEDAKEEAYLIITKDTFNTELFKKERKVVLPDCIIAITELKEAGGNFFPYLATGSGVDRDYRKLNTVGGGQQLTDQDDMLYWVVRKYYEEWLATHLYLTTFAFTYNRFTHSLFVSGRNPQVDVVATVIKSIPRESLYDNVYFFKAVLAEIYDNADLILSFVKVDLVGGGQLDTSKLSRLAERLRKEVQDDTEDSNSGADFWFFE